MSLDLSMLVRRVADLARRLDEMPALRWGTVVTSSPLTVRLDGDTDATGGLESMTGALAAGTRVLVVRWNRRAVVLGSPSRRGQDATAATVQMSGVGAYSLFCKSGESANIAGGDFFRQTITFDRPFKTTPVVIDTIQAGQDMKASVCHWGATTTSVTVRIDNLGTVAGWAVPVLLLIGELA